MPNITYPTMCVVSKFQVAYRLGCPPPHPVRRHSTLADAHVHDVHRWCFHVPWQCIGAVNPTALLS